MQMHTLHKHFNKDEAAKDTAPPPSNMVSGLYSIGKDEGVGVLFRGLGPACLEKVPSTAIGYYIYEGMKVAMGVKSV